MCLALPVRVIEKMPGDLARVEISGVEKEISLALVDGIETGDYVIMHAGYALSKLDEAEAQRTLELFADGDFRP